MKSKVNTQPAQGEIVSFFLKSPDGKRKSFSIIKRISGLTPEPAYSTFQSEQVDIINDLFLSGKKTLVSARKEFKVIISDLYKNEKRRRGDLISCDENEILVKEYLTRKYSPSKQREMDFKAVENETIRTLKALGTQSLLSISQTDLQMCIDKLEPHQQKRYASRLRSILKTLGRTNIELSFCKPKKKRIAHIDRNDLSILVNAIKNESGLIAGIPAIDFSDFVVALYCTGMRIGEALGIENHDLVLSKGYVQVRQQLKQDGTIDDTKNGHHRKSIIINIGLEETKSWVNLDKTNFSRFTASKYLSAKTRELFNDSNKHISSHGLRHSYAIDLLRVVDVSISSIAAFLGDTIGTTESFYIDYVISDENIKNIVNKMKRLA